jgi:putative flavoprotein involved in K+ transport
MVTIQDWLTRFNAMLEDRNFALLDGLFATESYWRDRLAFTWNIITLEGPAEIQRMLAQAPVAQFELDSASEVLDGVTAVWLAFETNTGRGKAHLRLKDGRAFTLLTSLEELKGFEEHRGPTRDKGITHGASKNRENWLERKTTDEAALGATVQPYCVIIGGGQGGIALGARLKSLGVPTIVLEKNAQAGDSWRNRYRSLVLHDPVWYDHLPYIPFPAHWPTFTPKDKMGDWLEMYTKVMELNYWSSSECVSATFDLLAREWNLRVRRNGADVTLRPKQLVFATGSYGATSFKCVSIGRSVSRQELHCCRRKQLSP